MFIAQYGQMIGLRTASEQMTMRLRSESFRTIMRQNLAFFDDPKNSVTLPPCLCLCLCLILILCVLQVGALIARLSVDAALVHGVTNDRLGVMVMVRFLRWP